MSRRDGGPDGHASAFDDEDRRFMAAALAEAEAAERAGEVPVGAIAVSGGNIVGRGRNGPVASLDPSAHAEIVAMRDAAGRLGNYRLTGCRLFVTLEPCLMCVGAMVHARIAEVVFAAADPKSGALGGASDALALHGLNHRFAVRGGLCAESAGRQLKAFFRQRRSGA